MTFGEALKRSLCIHVFIANSFKGAAKWGAKFEELRIIYSTRMRKEIPICFANFVSDIISIVGDNFKREAPHRKKTIRSSSPLGRLEEC